YDNLASLYTSNQIPGVGASVGLDRLIAAMEELKLLSSLSTPAEILVTSMDQSLKTEYFKIASELRDAGFKTDLFTEDKKFDTQLKYANRKGFKFVVIMGSQEFESQTVNIKNMDTGENFNNVPRNQLITTISLIKQNLFSG